MTYLCLMLEIHQPMRLNRSFPYERPKRIADGNSVLDRYFDERLNREVFLKVSKKCYHPTFSALLDLINSTTNTVSPFKVALGLSGPFLEQAAKYEPPLLDHLRKLVASGRTEVLGGTYYHSLASIFPSDLTEFAEQVKEHREYVRRLFGIEPKVFENTEFIYNNTIAKVVDSLGFKGMLTEGVEAVLGWRAPTYVYACMGVEGLKLILRHYRLTDDVGFRFSQRGWDQYPLTADKYASWLAATPGDVILIGLDVETFGEHHWQETGIFDFLRHLPLEIARRRHLEWALPSEVIDNVPSSGVILVPEMRTISWADVEKDVTAWIENPMQRISFDRVAGIRSYVREIGDAGITRIWRLLQQSDHFYYMSTKSGGPGEVHTYFSPYTSASEAFAVYDSVFADFEGRVATIVQRIRKSKVQPASRAPSPAPQPTPLQPGPQRSPPTPSPA